MRTLDSIYEVIKGFDGVLFDAYGVLLNESGCLPGAVDLLSHLKEEKIPYWMLSNGSSRTVADTTQKYNDLGLDFSEDYVITSGSLLASVLRQLVKPGNPIAVLGTTGSQRLVQDAGYEPISPLGNEFDILVIANQTEYPFVPSLDHALTAIINAIDSKAPMKIILTNPDLFYPKSGSEFGITAGAVSMILEESLKLRYGTLPDNLFIKLGKPYSPMFEEAKRRADTNKLLMVGDQIHTDVKGANESGLSSLLVGSGLTSESQVSGLTGSLKPDFFVADLTRGF